MKTSEGKRTTPDHLSGWQAIASYFKRDPSTVRRWAAQHGLPVYRATSPDGKGRRGATVFAYPDELDAWLKRFKGDAAGDGRTAAAKLESGPDIVTGVPPPPPQEGPPAQAAPVRRRLVHAAAVGLVVMAAAIGLAVWWPAYQPQAHNTSVAQPVPAEARELYLRGTYLWNRRTPESIAEAIPAFERALAIHPDYADAYAGLAMTYNLARQYSGMSGFEAYPLAEAAARRAVALDPGNAFAQTVLAFVEFHWLWDVQGGLARFEKALSLKPDMANALMWYASSLVIAGRSNDALPFIERAQQIDPGNTTILNIKAQVLFFSGDRQGGHALLASLIANDPHHAWSYDALSRFRMVEGDYAGALENYAKVGDLIRVPRYRKVAEAGLAALRTGGVPHMGAAMAAIDAELFESGEALAWDVARAHAMMGDAENAVAWLQISYERHEERLIGVLFDPAMRPIRNNAAYRRIVSDVGLSSGALPPPLPPNDIMARPASPAKRLR